MSRRSKAGGEPAKSQRRKTAMLKHRNAPKAMHNRGVSIAGKETVAARLTHERDEALEQLSAASEVLRVISSSPSELEPVFQAILANATRLCAAKFAGLSLYDGEALRYATSYNVPPEYADMRPRGRLW